MTDVFPGGWRKGDTCYLITNRAKRTTLAHTVESFDGRYFGVRGSTGLFHHVSLNRMFRSREDAVESMQQVQHERKQNDEVHTVQISGYDGPEQEKVPRQKVKHQKGRER